ncbi:MAG: DUF1631 family protein [Massilia sp.]
MLTNTKHLVRLAQEQALTSFAELVQTMLVETDRSISSAVRSAPATEHAAMNAARHWIGDKGREFRAKMVARYTVYLERAIETMHTDLRAGLHNFRADELTLVEDNVMTRQVELDRVVVRLRDVDQLSLGRINLTIATLHGVSKVLERENPFRPYLAARALYETMREMVKDTTVSKVLFDHMAGAMANQLPDYYAAILANFESRGMNARLLATPSEMNRAQRLHMNGQHGGAPPQQIEALQQLVWQVLDERKSQRSPRSAAEDDRPPAEPPAPRRPAVETQLRLLQRLSAGADGDQARPLAVSEQIGDKADPSDRLIIDLVGRAFDHILHEELLLPAMRTQLHRLHVPFLRAALLDPLALHDALHPARSLLDRLGTLAAGMRAHQSGEEAMCAEAARLIDHVLDRFDQDMAIFSDAERDLDRFVSELMRSTDPTHGAIVNHIDAAEASGAQFTAVQKALAALLSPLKPDPRIAGFIDKFWIDVILCQRDGGGDAELLPELIWSAQQKTTPADRAALLRTLPDLVRRVREGIELLGLPPQESQAALDQLVAVHMDVLGNRIAPGGPSMGLDWLRLHFGQFAATGTASAAAPLPRAEIERALAAHGVRATLYTEPAQRTATSSDKAWLAQARPGAACEAMIDGSFVAVRLAAVNAHHSAFVFSTLETAPPLVYQKAAMLAAIDGGVLRPLESASLFERAVGSVMAAGGLQAQVR